MTVTGPSTLAAGEGEGAVGVHRDRALGRIDGGAGDGERVAVRVGVVAKHREGDRLVLVGAGGVGVGDGAVVGAEDGEGHRRCRCSSTLWTVKTLVSALAFQGLDGGQGVVEAQVQIPASASMPAAAASCPLAGGLRAEGGFASVLVGDGEQVTGAGSGGRVFLDRAGAGAEDGGVGLGLHRPWRCRW